GDTLAAVNLPDNRVEIFDITTAVPQHRVSLFVGLDPVSVRFRNPDQLWVVNHISDSISVIDLNRSTITATIQTADSPQDLVFAGQPQRAYVSCSSVNQIQVFDVDTF